MKSNSFKTSDGVRLHYLETGAGPTILFVPGATAPANIWQPQIEYFSKHHRVVAIDPRSHGDSDKPSEGHYPERMACDIDETIDALDLKPVILVPWGIACSQTLEYVRHHGTGKLQAVAFVDGFVGREPTFEQVMEYLRWGLKLQEDRMTHQRAFVRSWFAQPHSDTYLDNLTAATMKFPTNSFVAMVGTWETLPNQAPLLSKIDVPLMYVFIEHKRPQAEVIRSHAPGARTELVDNAGHAIFVDQPDRFNNVLAQFIDRPSDLYTESGCDPS